MKKKRSIIIAVICAVIAAAALVSGNLLKIDTNKTEQETRDPNMALISIDNGAADANTDEAVNGLHVYDPDSEDLDDFADGSEVRLGTHVSIYVYNLASDVHLEVIHDGKTITDKDYPVLQSDEDVEFIDVTIEGDLEVKTSVVNAKNKDGIATVHINDEKLASVSEDGKEITADTDIGFGEHDFMVEAGDKDINARLKVGEKEIDTVSIKANASYGFSDIDVDGDVFFHFDYANAKDAEEAKKEKQRKAEQGLEVSDDQDGCSVTVSNTTGQQLDIRYLDDENNVHTVNSGSRYPAGLMIFSRVVNTSGNRLLLTASLNGQVVGSTHVEPKPANDDASFMGLDPIELNGNLSFSLTVVSGGSTEPQKPAPTAAPTRAPEPTHGTEEPEKYVTLTILDGAKSANTETAVNGLHVYDPSTKDMDDIASGTKIPLGTKLTIYEYNLASDVYLEITHNGKVIVSKNYDVLASDNDVDFIDVTLEGDITVRTAAGKQEPVPSPTVEPTPEPSEKEYSVTVDNRVSEASVNLSWMDDVPNVHPIQSGDRLKGNTGIFVQVLNPTPEQITVTAEIDGKTVGTAVISGGTDEVPGAGGLMGDDYQGIALTGDLKITVTKTETSPILTFTGSDHAQVLDPDSYQDYQDGQTLETGTHSFLVYPVDEKIHIGITVDGKQIADEDLTSEKTYELDVTGDVVITVTEVETASHTVTIENHAPQNTIQVSWMDTVPAVHAIRNGDAVAEGTGIYVSVQNESDDKLNVLVYVDDVLAGSAVIDAKGAGGITGDAYQGIALTGDMDIVIEEADVPVFGDPASAGSYVKERLKLRDPYITFDYEGITSDEVVSTRDAVMKEAYAHTGVGNEGDYLRYGNSGYTTLTSEGREKGNQRISLSIRDYNNTLEQETALDQKLPEIEKSLHVSNASDHEKAKAVYDWICNNVTYDHEHTEDSYRLKNTAYAAVIDGTAECDGYASLFYRMMNDLGVDTRFIAGNYYGGGHAWNIVKIDGSWYNVDSTHGAQLQDQNNVITAEKNGTEKFLKGSEAFEDHESFDEYTSEEFTSAYPIQPVDYTLGAVHKAGEVHFGGNAKERLDIWNNTSDAAVKEGEVLEAGKYSFSVYNKDNTEELTSVSLKVNGRTVASGSAHDYNSADFTDVVIPENAVIEFTAEKAVTVSIENETDAVLNIRWMDASMKPHDVSDGEAFSDTKTLYSQVINTTDQRVRLTAEDAEGNMIQQVTLEAKPANDDGTYGGLNPITLDRDLHFTLVYVDESKEEHGVSLTGDLVEKAAVTLNDTAYEEGMKVSGRKITVRVDNPQKDADLSNGQVTVTSGGTVIAGPETVGDGITFKDLEVGGNISIDISTPEDKREKFTLTIIDEAKKENTDTAVNGLHVYDPRDYENEYSDGAEIRKGQGLTVYEYNHSTPVHVTVTHNGETVADYVQQMVVTDKDVRFVEIGSIEGDVTVRTEAAKSETPAPKLTIHGSDLVQIVNEDSYQDYTDGQTLAEGEQTFVIYPMSDPVHVKITVDGETVAEDDIVSSKSYVLDVTGDVVIDVTQAETDKQYKVSVDNKVTEAAVNLSWMDENMERHVIRTGDSLQSGTGVFVQVLNPTGKKLKVTALIDGKEADSTMIEAGTTEDPGAGGLIGKDYQGLALKGDLKIIVEETKETYSFTVDGKEYTYGIFMDDVDIPASIDQGTHGFSVMAKEAPVDVTLKIGDKVIGTQRAENMDYCWFRDVTVDGPVTMEIEPIEE